MHLALVHYHLRPGGVRRVLEQATPWILDKTLGRQGRVTLLCGEARDRAWIAAFAERIAPAKLVLVEHPALGYTAEWSGPRSDLLLGVRSAIREALEETPAGETIVWAHNLGVGRNPVLAGELAAACHQRSVPLVAHHHDWWFDNRWPRWAEMRALGLRTLRQAAEKLFPPHPEIRHAAINGADARILRRRLPRRSFWAPNLAEPDSAAPPERVETARRWLAERLGEKNPIVWLVPCRLLRRKNAAEALLLARWLRPEAWLVVTGGASSSEETPYSRMLCAAANQWGWKLKIGILQNAPKPAPSVAELLAASETALLTSLQEGFGLGYLEAAAAGRPLIARALPNIMPDLEQFGFRFPHSYKEIWIDPALFDWKAERQRQRTLYRRWQKKIPERCRPWCGRPPALQARRPEPIPFSRLTLAGQLEALSKPAEESWRRCAPLNPQLASWRDAAAAGGLDPCVWPDSAAAWLSGPAYGERFAEALSRPDPEPNDPGDSLELLEDFIRDRLESSNLYPLLWSALT